MWHPPSGSEKRGGVPKHETKGTRRIIRNKRSVLGVETGQLGAEQWVSQKNKGDGQKTRSNKNTFNWGEKKKKPIVLGSFQIKEGCGTSHLSTNGTRTVEEKTETAKKRKNPSVEARVRDTPVHDKKLDIS